MSLQRMQKFEVKIDSLAFGGAGVGRVNGFTVFVEGTAPGDHVQAQVTRRRKNHAEARALEIVTPSEDRIEPPCPLVQDCGGCSWQHIDQEAQRASKRQMIEEVFAHLGKIPHGPIEPIIASPEDYRYRNKMDLTFGKGESGEVTIGFHRKGRYDQIIDVKSCLLQPEPFDKALDVIRQWANAEKLTSYDPNSHRGFLRSLILRDGKQTGEQMIILLTADGKLPRKTELVERLQAVCPGLKGFVWGLNTGKADIAQIERVQWAWGDPMIHERLDDLTFAITPMAFFQTNTLATELLYRKVIEELDLTGSEILLDAFCGTGTIGIFCARQTKQVYGVELHLPAVQMARKNAQANGLDNCTFIAGDVRETLPLVKQVAGGQINRVVVDPPRGGMHKKALAQIIDLQAPVFVYVSCNPTTLARDLQDLHAAGYTIDRATPLDLFPQTYHVETVVRLTR